MKLRQYLLMKLMEECAEVSHIASKQAQFGAENNNRTLLHSVTNAEHLRAEVNDLLSVIDLLIESQEIPEIASWRLMGAKAQRRGKIMKYLKYSQELGMVEANPELERKLFGAQVRPLHERDIPNTTWARDNKCGDGCFACIADAVRQADGGGI